MGRFHAAVFLACMAPTLVAMPASDIPYTVEQPDGTKIELRLNGLPSFHFETDIFGRTVVKDIATGYYDYAKLDEDGNLVSSNKHVGLTNTKHSRLEEFAPGILPPRHKRKNQFTEGGGDSPTLLHKILAEKKKDEVTTIPNLVIPIRWSDHSSRTLPSISDMSILMNNDGPDPLCPTGSVRDVYLDSSYNTVVMNSVVVDWIDVLDTEAYYADGQSGLHSGIWPAFTEALDALDATGFDFTAFDSDDDNWIDAIAFLHSGYGAEWGGIADGVDYTDRIWSHKWQFPTWTSTSGVRVSRYHISPGLWGRSGSDIGRIGVIAHETGHFLGLPDLYDGSGGSGIGSWGLMANSWGFDGSQLYPPIFSAWSKIVLNWISPTVIDQNGTFTAAAVYNDANAYYRIDHGMASNEFILIENRQAMGFDGKIPQGGLIIYHIDNTASYTTEGYPGQSGWPANGLHYRVAVLQKDGDYDMEKNNNRGDTGDAWYSSISGIGPSTSSSGPYPNTDSYQDGNIQVTGIRIYDISASGPTMTFKVEIPSLNADPTNAPIADPTTTPTSFHSCQDRCYYNATSPCQCDSECETFLDCCPDYDEYCDLTNTPTNAPIADPTNAPIADPTNAPIADSTNAPIADPTNAPIADPTNAPIADPTNAPIADPTNAPIADPTNAPIADPTNAPIADSTNAPIADPTDAPIADPTNAPIADPTNTPIADPTNAPIADPTNAPIADPTNAPIADATNAPIADPTNAPIADPTNAPIADATNAPIVDPTNAPIADPTNAPVSADCPGPFPGFSKCEKEITKLLKKGPAWFEARGLDGSRCSAQWLIGERKGKPKCPVGPPPVTPEPTVEPTLNPSADCPGPFPGFSKCEKEITKLLKKGPAWFEARGLDGSRCSAQWLIGEQKGKPKCPVGPPPVTPEPTVEPTFAAVDCDSMDEWRQGERYKVGDIVVYDGLALVCTRANKKKSPAKENASKWWDQVGPCGGNNPSDDTPTTAPVSEPSTDTSTKKTKTKTKGQRYLRVESEIP